MASAAQSRPEEELSVLRLTIMRVIYFAIAFLEGSQVVPALFSHEPTARGVIPALSAAFASCAYSGFAIRAKCFRC